MADAKAAQVAAWSAAERAGKTPAGSTQTALRVADEALQQELDAETAAILKQPPSDEGAAELEVLVEQAIGVERQGELGGWGNNGILARFAAVSRYVLNLARAHCTRASDSNEVVAWAYTAFHLQRQFDLLGIDGGNNEALATFQRCMLRARFELDVTDDSVASGDDLDMHVKVSAAHVPVKVVPVQTFVGVMLSSDPANLTYSASSVSVNSPFSLAESATIKTTGGTVKLKPTTLDPVTRVRCDKDRRLHLEYTVHLWLLPFETWMDTQTVTKSFSGGSTFDVPGLAAASAAWGETYDLHSPSFSLLTDGKTTETRDSGGDKRCKPPGSSDPNCHYSYSATFLARALPAGA
jgi:hypothetical protein